VTGASGQLGRRVVQLLLDAKAGTVVAATRTPGRLADLTAAGAVVRRADFDDPASLAAAAKGVDAMLLVSTDAVDRPGRRLAQHRAAIQAALEGGVKRIVYTSLINPGPESPITIAPDHAGTEAALSATPLAYTVLRDNVYADMLFHSLPHAVATGELVAAANGGGIAYVTREDCARVAAAVLAKPSEAREVLDVTGPEAVTFAQLAALAGELTGKRVVYKPVTAATRRSGLIAAGLPAVAADLYVSFDVAAALGQLAGVSDTVQRLTGRAPTRVAELLQAQRSLLG
jgi:NAD(P)H dehydrogenase (quinone)